MTVKTASNVIPLHPTTEERRALNDLPWLLDLARSIVRAQALGHVEIVVFAHSADGDGKEIAVYGNTESSKIVDEIDDAVDTISELRDGECEECNCK